MSHFKQHSSDTAPSGSTSTLKKIEKEMGFIPNLYRYMAESPAALKSYLDLSDIFAESSLSKKYQQILLLAISRKNECEFCVAAHTMLSIKVAKVDQEIIETIRNGHPTGDKQIDALITFANEVVEHRGWLKEGTVEQFLEAGFSQANVLDIIVGVSLKTLSNYTNHITQTTTNDEMSDFSWSKSKY